MPTDSDSDSDDARPDDAPAADADGPDADPDALDYAVVGATLLTMTDDRPGILEDGAVGVAGRRLAYVGPADGLDADRAAERIDARNCVVTPGFVNVHAHTAHTLLRGGAQDVPEREWMTDALGPLAAAATDADRVAGCRLGVLETVRGGTTTVAEYAGRVAELVESVYRPLGVGVVAVETINEVSPAADRPDDPGEPSPFDRGAGAAALDRADALFDRYADASLVTPAYGPQAVDMVSRPTLAAVADRARDRDARVHVHVAQGERERRQLDARYGDRTAVDVLDDAGLLGERLVAAHLHGADGSDRRRLVAAGASMAACPSSIAAIDGRVVPLAAYREAGGTVGLGTDQAPGPGHHDPLREARTAATLSKIERTDPTAFPAWRALRALTVGGARTLGLDDRIGTLEAGTRADLAVFDLDRLGPAPTVADPLHTAVPNLVYSTTGRETRDVFVAGRPVLRDGAFVDADADAAVAEARDRARDLFDRAAGDWREAGSELAREAEDWL